MNYDAGRHEEAIERLREACDQGRLDAAGEMLRHADAGLGTVRGRLAYRSLRSSLGDDRTTRLVDYFTKMPCPYCRAGRDACSECDATGVLGTGDVCADCAGLGGVRCAFCNGTSFAGYGFVPRGVRVAVMSSRLKLILARLAELKNAEPKRASDAKAVVKVLVDLDRCRGVLANAAEEARLGDEAAPGRSLFSHSVSVRMQRMCRKANDAAEQLMRPWLISLSERFARSTQSKDRSAAKRAIDEKRARYFAGLARKPGFEGSSLSTPRVLTDSR